MNDLNPSLKTGRGIEIDSIFVSIFLKVKSEITL